MSLNIPGYKIENLIAEGGMATVYLATQESLNRKVALKILKKFDTPEQSERFINEGKIIASLNHRNIITIHDIGVFEDKHYLSMEYLEGGDLESRTLQGISPDTALDLIKTIGHCLDFIHKRDIVHRDIKPANILFRKDNTPVLTDFGIAKHLQLDSNLTQDGTAMGSPSYLSPEQARNEKLDGRTDIYSLGVVLYQMFTGSRPYYGESYIDTVMEHLSAPIPTLPSHLKRYQKLLEKMMAKNPLERFASANEMVTFVEKLGKPNYLVRIFEAINKRIKSIRPVPDDKTEIFSEHIRDDNQKSDKANLATENPDLRHKPLVKQHSLMITGIVAVLLTAGIWLGGISQQPAALNQKIDVEQALQQGDAINENETEKPLTKPVSIIKQKAVKKAVHEKPEKHKKEIEKFLGKAEAALNTDRLTVPKDNNAYSYYKKVLKLEPKNKTALKGLSKIANRYADLAEWQILKYNYSKAKDYVYRGLDVQPNNKRLRELKKRSDSALKDASGRFFNQLKSAFE